MYNSLACTCFSPPICTKNFTSVPTTPSEAGLQGSALDTDYHELAMDLTTPAGFLLLVCKNWIKSNVVKG